jgi:hypothetical protein
MVVELEFGDLKLQRRKQASQSVEYHANRHAPENKI